MMDGATLRAGGVGGVERIANPVRAARKILSDSPHVYFVAEGAERFAAEHGIALCNNEDLVIPREVERLREFKKSERKLDPTYFSHDTVGAIALDSHGNIAAATSTGGTLNKTPGRLGDSSLIGWGEPIMKLVLAKWTADRVATGNLPEWAAKEAMNYLQRRLQGMGGIIVLDAQGRFGIAHNTPRMAWALKTSAREESGIQR
jgi:beta-aspartyl-peptidase (threonine type)